MGVGLMASIATKIRELHTRQVVYVDVGLMASVAGKILELRIDALRIRGPRSDGKYSW